MYSPLPFAIAQGNVELPYLLVQVGRGAGGHAAPASAGAERRGQCLRDCRLLARMHVPPAV